MQSIDSKQIHFIHNLKCNMKRTQVLSDKQVKGRRGWLLLHLLLQGRGVPYCIKGSNE